MSKRRIVFDTNVLISAALSPEGTSKQALVHAAHTGLLLSSAETTEEFVTRLYRPKFERYLTPEDRDAYALWVRVRTEAVEVTDRVAICRDPDDDKFLSLALSGKAEVIVSGDQDLLVLDPFRGVRIVKPAEFLQMEVPE